MSKDTRKEAKHTPGPWVADDESTMVRDKKELRELGPVYWIRLANEPLSSIAEVRAGHSDDGLPKQTKANATLIAAAPDMKFALDFALCHNDNPEAWPEALKHIREAIAKAEGR